MPDIAVRRRVLGLAAACTVAVLALSGWRLAAQNREDVQVIQGPGALPMPRDARQGPPSPAPAGTAIISGVVVSADVSRPVRRATVRLSGVTPGPSITTITDDQGRFTFEKVAAGRFTLTASKPGYLDSVYGQRRPGSGRPGTPLSVAEADHKERLSVPIARGGVLAGTVSDDGGEPAYGTEVSALKYVWQEGERVLRVEGSTRADDRGGYRIGALPPGDYVIMATPPGDGGTVNVTGVPMPMGRGGAGIAMSPLMVFSRSATGSPGADAPVTSGYAPIFYPGAASTAGATTIGLDVSEEHSGLDLQMPLVSMGRVSGTVVGDGTQSVDGTDVRLVKLDETPSGLFLRAVAADQTGRFSFADVPPGRYRVLAHSGTRRTIFVDQSGGDTRVTMQFMSAARGSGAGGAFGGSMGRGGPGGDPDEPQLWAAADVNVSGRDTETVSLVLQPGMMVSGRLVFDGTGRPPADLTNIRVVLNTSSQSEGGLQSAIGLVNADGSFTIPNVIPGAYRVAVLSAPNWQPKSFDMAGRDLLDTLVDVEPGRSLADAVLTLTTRLATLSGTLVESSGQPTAAYTIIVFADDPTYWTPQSRRIRATRPATDGRFSLGSLPAGRYRLAAVDDLEDGQWFDPAVLRQVAGSAIALTLGDGEAKTQDIRVAR